ncbi:MAG: hypothetical protein COW32_10710 [Candidatus Aquicultor secundus]|nr:MAG: hypothetical protein AUK32_02835 [Candidatus Aquicultor secundus]PIU26961.1 MAG: hypothetical protein COT10_05895 [Candidatus Aquicultor secundus]PIW21275.1 MAG: hypothetical protein COW32_10710 [Candidatus Aquicultor secundus]
MVPDAPDLFFRLRPGKIEVSTIMVLPLSFFMEVDWAWWLSWSSKPVGRVKPRLVGSIPTHLRK